MLKIPVAVLEIDRAVAIRADGISDGGEVAGGGDDGSEDSLVEIVLPSRPEGTRGIDPGAVRAPKFVMETVAGKRSVDSLDREFAVAEDRITARRLAVP